eukprot:9473226-Pyramimonas_sp.AAC.1
MATPADLGAAGGSTVSASGARFYSLFSTRVVIVRHRAVACPPRQGRAPHRGGRGGVLRHVRESGPLPAVLAPVPLLLLRNRHQEVLPKGRKGHGREG